MNKNKLIIFSWFLSCLFLFPPTQHLFFLSAFNFEIFPLFFLIPLILGYKTFSIRAIPELFLIIASFIIILLFFNSSDAIIQSLQLIFVIFCSILFISNHKYAQNAIAQASFFYLLFFLFGLILEAFLPNGIPFIDFFRARTESSKEDLLLYTGGVRFLAPEPSYAASLCNGLFLISYSILEGRLKFLSLIVNVLCLLLLRSTGGILYFLILFLILSPKKSTIFLLTIIPFSLIFFDILFENFVWFNRIATLFIFIFEADGILEIFSLDKQFGSTRMTSLGEGILAFFDMPSNDFIKSYSAFALISANIGFIGGILIALTILTSLYLSNIQSTFIRILVIFLGAPILIIPKSIYVGSTKIKK